DDIFLALRGSENHSLSSIDFVVGDRALTGDQNIIYNIKTGGLFYDADGAGGQAAFSIATLTRGLALTSDDFAIV
ncbi:MAG: calcium-binding protein, partial [Beijerinckiaceae bacterium]